MHHEMYNRMHEIVSRITTLDDSILSPAFHRYCRALADPTSLKTYIRHKLDTLQLGKRPISDNVILDAGCGFGVTCLLFAVLGAREVHGVDIVESRLDVFKAYLRRLNSDLPIYPRLQSVMALDYPNDYFDIVFSNEAISHYGVLPSFLREMHRVLRRGGVLLIADSNNGANAALVRKCRKIWERFEQGPAGSFGTHRIEKPYLVMRREIIQEQFPHLSESELKKLSTGTFAMDRGQVISACKEYLESGKRPQSFYTGRNCPVNPLTGAVIERCLHPFQLAQQMRSYGLQANAYAYFGGAAGTSYIRMANKILTWFTPLSIYFALGFRIAAVKEG